jgi:hypothetical protein
MEAQRHGSFPLSRLDGEDNGIPPKLGGHPILSRQVDNHSHHAIIRITNEDTGHRMYQKLYRDGRSVLSFRLHVFLVNIGVNCSVQGRNFPGIFFFAMGYLSRESRAMSPIEPGLCENTLPIIAQGKDSRKLLDQAVVLVVVAERKLQSWAR